MVSVINNTYKLSNTSEENLKNLGFHYDRGTSNRDAINYSCDFTDKAIIYIKYKINKCTATELTLDIMFRNSQNNSICLDCKKNINTDIGEYEETFVIENFNLRQDNFRSQYDPFTLMQRLYKGIEAEYNTVIVPVDKKIIASKIYYNLQARVYNLFKHKGFILEEEGEDID